MTGLRRFSSLLAFSAFVAALWGQVFHLAVVRHEVCAEHGELVEHTEDNGAGGGDPAPLDADRHDHCLTVSGHAVTLAREPTWNAPPAAALDSPVLLGSEPDHGRSVPLLCEAPKTSPPHISDA